MPPNLVIFEILLQSTLHVWYSRYQVHSQTLDQSSLREAIMEGDLY